MNKSRYRVGAIGRTGGGNFGHGLHLAFSGISNIEMVAIADPDKNGRVKAQTESGASRSYSDYQEMLSRESLDIVCVCPRWLDQRLEMVLASINAGCHVYCEKPFAISLDDGDRMVTAADSAGKKIAVGHFHGAYMPGFDQLKNMIDTGLIGKLIEVHGHGKHDHRGGGEDMMDLGTHVFNLMQRLAGDVAWVSAHITAENQEIIPGDVHEATEPLGPVAGDHIQSYFAFHSGVIGSFDSRRNSVGVNERYGVEIVGANGTISLRGGSVTEQLMIYPFPLWAPARQFQSWQPLEIDVGHTFSGHNLAAIDLIESIESDRDPICSGRDGIKAIEMALAAYTSQITGARVFLPLTDRSHPLMTWN